MIGTADPIVALASAAAIAERCGAELKVYEHSGHEPFVKKTRDPNCAAYLADVRAFIDACVAGIATDELGDRPATMHFPK